MREWLNRLFHSWRRRGFDRELDEEIRFHLEARAADLVAAGASRADAALQARREFGSIIRTGESVREVWTFRWIADFAVDFRIALRSFRRSPPFAITAVLSLGLAIGAAGAVFSMLDAALWRPLPVADPGRLVKLTVKRTTAPSADAVPVGAVSRLRRVPVFDGVLSTTADGLSFQFDGRAERILGQVVSPNYFAILGVRPLLGRYFSDGPWAPEAVLSYRFWQRRFGGDPGVIGRTIRLNTRPFQIVGVSPPSFFGVERGRDYEIQLPQLPDGVTVAELSVLSPSPDDWTNVMARLRPGVSLAQASEAVDTQLRDFVRTASSERFRRAGILRAGVAPGADGWTDDNVRAFGGPMYILLGLVAAMLLIACANVAGMLLARAAARRRELAIRCSIGAGRARLVRQMLAESLAIAALGCAVAMALAAPAAEALFGFVPQGHIPMLLDLRTDARAVLFTLAVTLLTTLAFGLYPAVQSTRGSLVSTLRPDARGVASGRSRRALVAAQVAFSMALLVTTGAFLRGEFSLRPLEYGPAPDRVLLLTIKPPVELYSPQKLQRLVDEIQRRVSGTPGVQSAAFAEAGPLASRQSSAPVALPNGGNIRAESDAAGPGFFATAGIPILAGREFGPADAPSAGPVVVVNQSLGRGLFGSENPVGRTLIIRLGKQDSRYRIVGVAVDTHYYDLHMPPQPVLWTAAAQNGLYMPTLLVRSAGSNTGAVLAGVRHELDAIDRGFPVFNVRTLEARIGDALAGERMVADFAATLGGLAVMMAAVGIYGLLAYAVDRRAREIGIRMALGADVASVVRLVAGEVFGLTIAGAAAGALLAWGGERVIRTSLPAAVSAAGWVFLVAAAGIAILSIAASTPPVLRAVRTDPVAALRSE